MTSPAYLNRLRMGLLLRRARKAKGLRLWQVAEHMNRSISWVQRIEKGDRDLRMGELVAFAQLYEVDSSELIHKVELAAQRTP